MGISSYERRFWAGRGGWVWGQRSAHCAQFQVGGISVQVGGESRADVALVSSLNLFRVDVGASDISIQIERASRLTWNPGRPLFDSGSVWRLFEDDDGFQFDFTTPDDGGTPLQAPDCQSKI